MLKKFFVAIMFAALLSVNICYAKEELATVKTSEGWSVRLMKLDTLHYDFEIMDKNGNCAALVPYSTNLYDFYYDTHNNKGVVIFVMGIYNAPIDDDEGLGEWEGSTHYLPVYACFEYETPHKEYYSMYDNDDGIVKLDSWLGSCFGLSNHHYHGIIKSPHHFKLTEVLLTNMPELHRVINSKRITLP